MLCEDTVFRPMTEYRWKGERGSRRGSAREICCLTGRPITSHCIGFLPILGNPRCRSLPRRASCASLPTWSWMAASGLAKKSDIARRGRVRPECNRLEKFPPIPPIAAALAATTGAVTNGLDHSGAVWVRQMDIDAWLRELGLERYSAAFLQNDVTAEVLPHLSADDLKELGVVSVGHRRQLLAAIGELGKKTPPPEQENGVQAVSAGRSVAAEPLVLQQARPSGAK